MGRTLVILSLLMLNFSTLEANQKVARKRRIDILHLSLDVTVDLQRQLVEGSATIAFTPLYNTKEIYLDAAFLEVRQITSSNNSLQFVNRGTDEDEALMIQFEQSLIPGDEISIQIDYKTQSKNLSDPLNIWGSFGKGIRYLKPSSSEPRRRWQAWSIGQPGSNRYWYPCYDEPNDQFNFEITAHVDHRFWAISNGELVEKISEANNLSAFHWKLERPISNHQVSIVVGEYIDLKDTINGLVIHNYSYPDELEATKASTDRLKDMVNYFSKITDTQFPYSSYSQVFVQDIPWGGGHHAAASTITENMIDDYGTHADFLYLWDGVEANDLAAQWFGNLLTPYSWEHVWLNKSFANYFSTMYNEYKNGLDEVQLWVRSFNQSTILGDWANNYRRPLVIMDSVDASVFVNDNYSTIYGAEVLHMLRKQVGEENWIKIIKQYLHQYAGKLVTTDQFFNVVQEVVGEPMHWFFDQWVYKMGHPVFEVRKEYNKEKKELNIFLKQIQVPDSNSLYPQTKFFKGNIEVEIDDKIFKFWIPAQKETEFKISLPSKPSFVNIDFERRWIKDINYDQSFAELLNLATKSKDILARNESILTMTSLCQIDSVSLDDKNSFFRLLEEVSTGKDYWRLRMTALGSWRNLVAGKVDQSTATILRAIVKGDSSWMRSTAIAFLGDSKNPVHFTLYQQALADKSDRVVNAAAIAIGKSKHPKAFAALIKLRHKPSWKNQSLISCLNGLFQLGNPAGSDIALDALRDDPPQPRWTLANTTWDYRYTAASTLAKLGKVDKAHSIIEARLKKSLEENSILDIFNNLQLMSILGDPRAQVYFEPLKKKYVLNSRFLHAVNQLEADYKNNLAAKK